MDRRSFIKLFAAAGPVAAVAPTYFFAPVGGWKSDAIINPNETIVHGDRIYFLGKEGVYENGILILVPIDHELWGLAYWQTRPPHVSDTYLGISRTMRC